MSRLHELYALGQSVWLDNIRRALITSGELADLLDAGIMGVTSNPSIFEKAIAGSADYDEAIVPLTAKGLSVAAIAETLAIDDIQRAASVLRPVFQRTAGVDGHVSLEVDPTLAHDAQRTIDAALRLHRVVARPNVMIKVPATPAGIIAIEALVARGISINVTLIFSLATYEQVANAYVRGIRRFTEQGGDPSAVVSVASIFVSRIDTAVDAALAAHGATALQGQIAVANAKLAYRRFQEIFSGPDWKLLADRGARPQRLLWASTGTKNPAYADPKYVDELIGPDTVNTVPPATLGFVMDHGTAATTLTTGVDEARLAIARLADVGIDFAAITQTLQDEAVAGFTASFEALNRSIEAKQRRLAAGRTQGTFGLGAQAARVEAAVHDLRTRHIMKRIWRHDHTVWRPAPDEITNRLGWLHAPETILAQLPVVQEFVAEVWAAGYRQAVLLGMGGSSLAPEVFEKTFARLIDPAVPRLPLTIIDTTDPDAIRERTDPLDLSRTLVIVATKSGNTVETMSAFKFLYNRVAAAVGAATAGDHFIAITDPGSDLTHTASTYQFRRTFLNDPNIGGRYAALSLFGIVPAALVGVDVERLLAAAATMACNAESANCPVAGDNLAARLGVAIGELALAGRDKLTFITSPALASFGDWVEQLIAESTGKDGRGIVPVVGEPVGPPAVYGEDRVFVRLALNEDHADDESMRALREAGHPVITLRLDDAYDLGGQFFLWEMATAVAAARLRIQPFDQPNVEAAKQLTRQMVSAYFLDGKLPGGNTVPPGAAALAAFLRQARPGDYVSIQAYLNATAAVHRLLDSLRRRLRDQLVLATTVGYGPRYLHSTGQLHKGDSGNGLFIQLISRARHDLPIPDQAGAEASTMTFGVLKAAQALGDAHALEDAGRRVIRFDLGSDMLPALEELAGACG